MHKRREVKKENESKDNKRGEKITDSRVNEAGCLATQAEKVSPD